MRVDTNKPLVAMTKYVLLRNPKWSKRMPATEGPTNAPNAKVLVHNPLTNPYLMDNKKLVNVL